MECSTHQYLEHHITILIMCLSIASIFIPCLIVCSIDVQLESEATPFVEDTVCEPRQQGKQTPLIMSIKSHFPLSLAYACLGDHLVTFYRIDEPIPMHDLSFCHRIKQTTILADIGIEC